MEFSFELATEKDDADLRRLLANSAMPGRITVTFEREPNYFLGCETMGRFWQVLIARHQPSGELAGVICRGTRPHFINGRAQELGYIGQLRVAKQYQGRWVLSRGLPKLRELHADGRVAAYFAAISDENVTARGVLVAHARRYFPALRELAHIYTLGIILRKPKPKLSAPYEIGRGTMEQLREIVTFLRQQGAAMQFFPAYTASDFVNTPTTRDFKIEDFIVARRGGEIIGVTGLWDQSGYKQSVVQGYNGSLRWLKPFYNIGARLGGMQPLPARGEHINSAYASFICVANNDPHIFRAVLREVYNLAAERRYAYLMLGLTERDPLLAVAREYAHIAYHSSLYTVCWDDAEDFHDRLDERVPYIEIATL